MNKKIHRKPNPDYVFDIGDNVLILESAYMNSDVAAHCIGEVYMLDYFDGIYWHTINGPYVKPENIQLTFKKQTP